jgi:hypothetical protein
MPKRIQLSLSEALSQPMSYPSLGEFQRFVSDYRFSQPNLAPLMGVVRHPLLWVEFFVCARCWWDWKVWETLGREELFLISASESHPSCAPSHDRIVWDR